jgi:hypothetical protein
MSDPTPHTPGDAVSRLCLQCGMCCNGVMFSIVQLQPGESAKALGTLGLKVKRGYFTQPCAALDGLTCTIYESRPVRCRAFSCQQIHRLQNAQTTESEVLDAIRHAQRLAGELNALLEKADAINPRKSLAHRAATALTELPPSPLRDQIAATSAALENLLDSHFRITPLGPLIQQPPA